MRLYVIASTILASSLFFSCNSATPVVAEEIPEETPEEIIIDNPVAERPVNIILMIADGTGLSQISASQFFNVNPSNYERFKHIGLIKTSSSSDLITDSAAGATAFASGIKTYNGAIGVDDNEQPKITILEELERKGYKTGVIATSTITHATPASFYAHVSSRKMEEEIAQALTNSKVDFFAGGGLKFFNERDDKKDLIQELQTNGFEIETATLNTDAFLSPDKKYGYLLAQEGMPKMIDGRGPFLKNATQIGINYLSQNQHPFFMMVEGSQIDWGGHENNANYLIGEMIDFDDTMGYVLDYAQRDGNTLVIVTADHETGGFTLAADDGNYNLINPTFSTGGHSATMVPVFAYGPGAGNFAGVYENTEIYHIIKRILSR